MDPETVILNLFQDQGDEKGSEVCIVDNTLKGNLQQWRKTAVLPAIHPLFRVNENRFLLENWTAVPGGTFSNLRD